MRIKGNKQLAIPVCIGIVRGRYNVVIFISFLIAGMSLHHVFPDHTIANHDFVMANTESLGFLDDISSATWNLMKAKVSEMSPNYNTWCLPHMDLDGKERGDNCLRNREPFWFYQNHYEPDFVCQHERRIGNLGDGGKWICDPHRIVKQDSCLVYSIGSNNDFSFEESVFKEISSDCEIHTFDFRDYNEGAKKAGVHYHQVGLGMDIPPRYKSLSTIVKSLGHEGRIVDIFKIDCEGCEWFTATKWFEADITLRQIQIELHNADIQQTPKFFDLMYKNNYVITHKEPNIANAGGKKAIEYAFLKLASEFSKDIVRPDGAASEKAS
uniref:Methyltransferase domain-containing protein n=1 Tax=Eucampia antarctica TaxID=49252 RepID=A0A7S2RBX2_9STRA|mmetsp:Transcript_20160/g.19409  ORF Transcript_20160/g.19409 Transcript_20160/m.19409 type:complete len:325 (+) Transcript_20160:94-1068(+)